MSERKRYFLTEYLQMWMFPNTIKYRILSGQLTKDENSVQLIYQDFNNTCVKVNAKGNNNNQISHVFNLPFIWTTVHYSLKSKV